MKELDLENKKFIMITDNGVFAHGMQSKDIMPRLLLAFLSMWDEHCFPIDIGDAAERVIEVVGAMRDEDDEDEEVDDFYSVLSMLFDEEENG